MSLSIRARLTLWYSAVVITVLISFTTAVSVTQRRFELSRIDAELMRLSRLVEGVMRMEIRERRTLAHAAVDTSIEVAVSDHALRLEQTDGEVLAEWGVAVPPVIWPPARDGLREGFVTPDSPAGPVRLFRRAVQSKDHAYVVLVAVPLQGYADRQREMASALWIGSSIALVISAIGGWLLARQTLAPLASMARQAAAASSLPEAIRLSTPQRHDEAGRLAAAFNALLDRISSATAIQRQFMADASHELRTPISVVRTAAEAALSQPHRHEHEYREALTIVSAQSARLTRLVDDMLFLSRSDAGGVQIRHDAVDLDELVAGAVALVKVVAVGRHLSLHVSGPSSVTVVGDEAQLHRMLVNLLTNAVRHAAPGSIVHIEIGAAADAAVLRVTNHGEPIRLADRTRIFDRFVSLASDADGAGLGLPIARRIAEAHGGQLTLLSSDEAGTTFEVRLPM